MCFFAIPVGIFLGVMLGVYPVVTLCVIGGAVVLFLLNGLTIEIGNWWRGN